MLIVRCQGCPGRHKYVAVSWRVVYIFYHLGTVHFQIISTDMNHFSPVIHRFSVHVKPPPPHPPNKKKTHKQKIKKVLSLRWISVGFEPWALFFQPTCLSVKSDFAGLERPWTDTPSHGRSSYDEKLGVVESRKKCWRNFGMRDTWMRRNIFQRAEFSSITVWSVFLFKWWANKTAKDV